MTPRRGGIDRALLLLGASTRALAASVRRSGRSANLLALDLFADVDQERLCRCLTPGRDLPGPRRTSALMRAALGLAASAPPGAIEIVFSGGMETHPRLLAALEARLHVLGNRASDVRAVRDPVRFFGFLARSGIPHPRNWPATGAGRPRGPLLWKPRRSGGGARIRTRPPWPARGGYLQQRVRGRAGSVTFVADGRRARVLGYFQVLSGEPELGAPGLAYSGNLWGPPGSWLPAPARRVLARAVRLVTAQFHLRGLNGIDFILRGNRPLLLEVNPRYTASMELIEELRRGSLFAVHRRACEDGRLPGPGAAEPERTPARLWVGKGIVYARRNTRIVSLAPFLRVEARDVPRPGITVRAGAPLCTVVARALGAEECRRGLLAKAALLRRELDRAAGPDRQARSSC